MSRFFRSTLSGVNLVGLIHFLFFLGFSGAGMLQPLLTLHLQLSQTEIGTLLFISSICSSLVRIPAGIASDRYGRRPSVFVAGIIVAASAVLYFIAKDFTQMLVPFSLWGIGVGIYWTSHNAMIADVTEAATRFKAYSRVQIIGQIANLISPPIAGFLADCFGIAFAYLFPAVSFTALCFFSLKLKLPARRINDGGVKTTKHSLLAFKIPSRLRTIIFFFASLNVIHGFYVGIFWPARTIIFKSQFHLGYSEIGFLNSSFMVAQILGLTLSNRIAHRFQSKWVMTLATVSSAIVVSLHSVTNSMWLMPLTMIHGFTLAFGFMSPIGTTIFMNSISESMRATVQGITGTVWRLGMASGNIAMGSVWTLYGLMAIPFIGMAILVGESVLILTQLPAESSQAPS